MRSRQEKQARTLLVLVSEDLMGVCGPPERTQKVLETEKQPSFESRPLSASSFSAFVSNSSMNKQMPNIDRIPKIKGNKSLKACVWTTQRGRCP